mmetsp:Transcript_4692/g.10622  ORF Transcript_4692/g.10622 Transcript_4692/m.10622 type:complete len:166 (-) Transcript_4692:749-1246(-)
MRGDSSNIIGGDTINQKQSTRANNHGSLSPTDNATASSSSSVAEVAANNGDNGEKYPSSLTTNQPPTYLETAFEVEEENGMSGESTALPTSSVSEAATALSAEASFTAATSNQGPLFAVTNHDNNDGDDKDKGSNNGKGDTNDDKPQKPSIRKAIKSSSHAHHSQ